MSQLQLTYKPSLAEANTIKRALEFYYIEQGNRVLAAGGGHLSAGLARLPGTAQEMGRVETLLRRDFETDAPKLPPAKTE